MAEEEDRPGAPGEKARTVGYELWPIAVEKVRHLIPGLAHEHADQVLVGLCTAETRPIKVRRWPSHDTEGVADWELTAKGEEHRHLRYSAFVYLPDLLAALRPSAPDEPSTTPNIDQLTDQQTNKAAAPVKTRGYRTDDEPLWREMDELMRSGMGSVRAAAIKVVGKAKGASPNSTIDRLRKGYAKWPDKNWRVGELET